MRRLLSVVDAVSAARSTTRRRLLTTILGILVFLGASALVVSETGLLISEDTVFLWVLAALFALSLTDIGRWGRGLAVDWLPLGLLLLFYDSSRGFSELLNIPTHRALQIGFDDFVFGQPLPTAQLQHWLHQSGGVAPWDYPLFVVYMSHFFAALVVAGILWRFAYPRFRAFRVRLIVLTGLGFVTYVLYPAEPPWMVATQVAGSTGMDRVVVVVWNHVGLHTADTIFEKGNPFYNQVAAVPSMHAAITLLILMFFWRGARLWARALLVAYVLAMAFVLVYGAEHYVFDIVLGWIYAVAVMAGATALNRARARRRLRMSPSLAPDLTPVPVAASVGRPSTSAVHSGFAGPDEFDALTEAPEALSP